MRINVGCGQTPITGWRNFDNSFSVRLAKLPLIPDLMFILKILNPSQNKFIQFIRSNKIEFGDVARRLPVSDGSVEVLYCSHMLEHLSSKSVLLFLNEAKRIVQHDGILRIAVPDIRKQALKYLKNNDADAFLNKTLLAQPPLDSYIERLIFLFVGPRQHQWMYDGKSLCRLLKKTGFVDVRIVPAGKTKIKSPKPLNLFERSQESVYVEAKNP